MIKFPRLLFTLPFLVLFYLSLQKLDASAALVASTQIVDTGSIKWASTSVPVVTEFFRIEWLDAFWCPIVVLFSQWFLGFDEVGSWL
jgi:hypothetical protein